jgi:hypothetical protein
MVASNAYPWLLRPGQKVGRAKIRAGIEPLRRLLELLPRLRVVMLNGKGAPRDSWDEFSRRYPSVASRYVVLPTYHTSRTAFRVPDEKVRDARLADLRTNFRSAARILRAERPKNSFQNETDAHFAGSRAPGLLATRVSLSQS